MLKKKGEIKFPKVLEPFSKQNYITVQEILQNVGFRNITCISMHDLKFGLLPKSGREASIHEEPFVQHAGQQGTGLMLVPGMVFTIEPMINGGKAGVYIDADNHWTVLTEILLASVCMI